MGELIAWHCNECSAEEVFSCGCGFNSFNEPFVTEESRAGTFGSAMELLFGHGIPDGWSVVTERVYYRCEGCGEVHGGLTLEIDDGGGGRLVFYPRDVEWETHCAENDCRGRKLLSTDDLFARCEERTRRGCPACGGENVQLVCGSWD